MIPILVLKTENKVIYNKSNLNCKTFFEEFSLIYVYYSNFPEPPKLDLLIILSLTQFIGTMLNLYPV